jgi:hypothetical protein
MSDSTPLIRFLEHATPEMWHQVAWNWNWDNGTDPLTWIIRQSTCASGTALLIYWYGGPRWYTQYETRDAIDAYQRTTYDLLQEIEQHYVSGRYTNQSIAFDPTNDEGIDWTKEYADELLRQPIPEMMFAATSGQPVERVWLEEGLPQDVIDELHREME